jgi:hypothetical protein
MNEVAAKGRTHHLEKKNSSENTCRRIAILGQVSPIPTLRFVIHSRGKAKVGSKILSENLLGMKVRKKKCQMSAMIL